MNFYLDKDQEQQLDEWIKTLPPIAQTAIGGRLTFSFTPTSIGDIVTVEDASGKKLDLTGEL